jgi:hypothetical protein
MYLHILHPLFFPTPVNIHCHFHSALHVPSRLFDFLLNYRLNEPSKTSRRVVILFRVAMIEEYLRDNKRFSRVN